MGFTGLIRKLALTAGIMLLGLAAACGGGSDGGGGSSGGSGDSGGLFPQRANVVGSVASADALNAIDLDLDRLLDMLSSDLMDEGEGFEKFFNIEQFRPGGLFGDISRIDVFGEITGSDDVDYFGLLLNGNFDETALIEALESVSGEKLVRRKYKDRNVYSPADDPDEFDLSFLNNSTLVIGSGGAVNDVIDIDKDDVDAASGPLIATFNDLDGGLFALALEVPEDLGDDADFGAIPLLADLPISLDFISALEMVGLGGALEDGSLDITVTMDFTNEDAAESLESFIRGIVTLAGGFLADPSTAGLLDGLEIDRDGSLLTIEIEIPVADIPGIFGDIISPASVETFTSSGRPPGTPEIKLLASVIGQPVPIMQSVNHVPEGQGVDYSDSPPTSGQHWPATAPCGFYSDGLPDERVVHNLEHGNIIVSYNFTNPAEVTALRLVLDGVRQFDDWGVARSYDKIPDGQVVITAWGHLHRMEGVDPVEIGLFFEAFAGVNGPERFEC
ncbi:MAG: DUF3105 domain-containing protein [Chloroflexi bacterium]|nr:DUF3105 domain-containing protein [Chloroflexota bacterium]